ncbi:MAG: hypothetical protein ACRDHW_02580 [Ktedonobacteraceae bacterium]
MNTSNDAQISRREALRRLATLPLLTLKLNPSQPVQHRPVEDILTQCAASIAACWELSKGNDEADLALAFKGVSAYVPTLKSLKKDMEQTLHFWKPAAQGARILQSEQRFKESLVGYEIMESLWPRERRIIELRDLAIHW